MKLKRLQLFLAVLAAVPTLVLCPSAAAASASWSPIGPDGGDARRLAFDPRDPSRMYLGTTDSWIYASSDGGSSWSPLAKLAGQDNLVIDSLLVDKADPRTLYAGVYALDQSGGGVYISHDMGHTWTEAASMHGQPVFAIAQAPSRASELVAGTLRGVFRSEDSGQNWHEISPPGSTEVHEVQSVAIDPYDPGTIYAGTWHLPWKTTDGGANWKSIKEGLIDDSDVFSMIVDLSRPSVLFVSACSGIYRTDDFGGQFRKVQGIPSTARRTRVLKMDPSDRNTVYAGTTEGLYITHDGGGNWARTTGPTVIVNDVYVDPRNTKHVLLATDRGGVLASEDAGVTFEASNTGFSQRQVAALMADAKDPGTLYAGVVNGKAYGGVFITTDSGRTWKQASDGLNGLDVFELAQGADGTVLAGTSNGIFRWSSGTWTPGNSVGAVPAVPSPAPPAPAKKHAAAHSGRKSHHSVAKKVEKAADPATLAGGVTALTAAGDTWYAATVQGVYRSSNDGASWDGPILGGSQPGKFTGVGTYTAIAVSGDTIYASRRDGIMVSTDGGATWEPVIYPAGLTAVVALAAAPDGSVWAGGREGVFHTSDRGHTWGRLQMLPVAGINSLAWDGSMHRILLTSAQSTVIFAIDPADNTWKWWNAGWTVHTVTSMGGRLAAASLFSGVVAQPQPETASAGGTIQNAQN